MTYLEQRRQFIQAGRPLKQKERYTIKRVSDKRAAKIREQRINTPDVTLDAWFDHFMKVSEPICMECGFEAQWLKQPEYATIWRACQAHLLPKRKNYGFPSLATNFDNHLVLFPSWGGHLCGCHGFYDSNWYNASTMKIWDEVVKTFQSKLYALIPQAEQKNIPEILLTIL